MNRSITSDQKIGNAVSISNQEGVDIPIESLRTHFESSLAWLSRSYGRAYDRYRVNAGQKEIRPFVWQGKSVDLLDVLQNDNVNSFCYFRALDPEEPVGIYEDYEEDNNQLCRPVQIVFVIKDLENLPGFTGEDHRYIDTLKNRVRTAIKSNIFPPQVEWDYLRSYDEPKNVLKGYTYDLFHRTNHMHPSLIFVIEVKFTYFEDQNFCTS